MTLYAIGAALVVGLGILWRMLFNAKKSGVLEQKAKEAEARNANIKRLKDAIDAGAHVRPDDPGVHNDPHDLDR